MVYERKGHVPYLAWANLPLPQSVALRAGLVKREPCPDCFGTGWEMAALKAEITTARLDKDTKACTACYGAGYVHKTLGPSTKWEGVLGNSTVVEVCIECRSLTWNQLKGVHKALCGCDGDLAQYQGQT